MILTSDLQFLSHLDARTGSTTSMPPYDPLTVATTTENFDHRVRLIIQELKQAALRHSVMGEDDSVDIMTVGYAMLLARADEDFLVHSILDGVFDSTKYILGMEGYTLDDMRSLPRVTDSKLSEHGIYIDVVEIGDDRLEWKLYVGSASGEFGVVGRWYTYLAKQKPHTFHDKEIAKEGRNVNLRCVATFGHNPDFWLTALAESVFVLYTGSLCDPRLGWRSPEYESRFIFDSLYEEASRIRSACALTDRGVRGLNLTLPIVQGWGGRTIAPGTKCSNCTRVVPEVNDPEFKPKHWRYANPSRPAADYVTCRNCCRHFQTFGEPRPQAFEDRRAVISIQRRCNRPNPGHCEAVGCIRLGIPKWDGANQKFYCQAHYTRARTKTMDMETPTSLQARKKSRPTHEKPDACEHDSCTMTTLTWSQWRTKWLCCTHSHRAVLGKDGSTITQADRDLFYKRTSVCQYPNCDSTSWISFCKKAGKYYCSMHYQRANAGIDMDQPKRQKRKDACDYIYTSGQACTNNKSIRIYVDPNGQWLHYCSMHLQRAKNGQDMEAPNKMGKAPAHCQYIYTSGQACNNSVRLTKYTDPNGHRIWYCRMHQRRATKGQDMEAPNRQTHG